MNKQGDYDNYLKMMALDYTSTPSLDPSVHRYAIQPIQPVADLNAGASFDPPKSSSWVHDQETSRSYIKFMTENSTYDHRSSFGDVSSQGISLPGSGRQSQVAVKKYKGKQHKIECYERVSSWIVMPSRHVPRRNNLDYSMAGSGLVQQTNNTKKHDRSCVHESRSEVKVEQPIHIAPKPSHKTYPPYSKAAETDRNRRLTIAARIEALQRLLPESNEGARESVLDDVIGYITHLQLRLKELTQSRLGGELSSNPFISLERFGRDQMIDETTKKETLDVMLGNLLMTSPSKATRLLESKGLVIMPMRYAGDLPNKPTI